MNRIAFLDRDGTIIRLVHYLSTPEAVQLLPGAADGVRFLRSLGFRIVVVTNQSAVGRGYIDRNTLDRIHDRLVSLLEAGGATVDAVYYCPHLPADGCRCRKPGYELAVRAATDLELSLEGAVMIGDNMCDMAFGRSIGATTVLVRTGYGEIILGDLEPGPDLVAADLYDAARRVEALVASERYV